MFLPYKIPVKIGKESRRCIEELTGRKKILPRQLFYANIQQGGELIDRGMAVFLPGPFFESINIFC